MAVRIELDHAAIQRMLHSPSGLVYPRVAEIGRNVQRAARGKAPRATGRLAGSIFLEMASGGGEVSATIGTPLAYGLYQHEGTGVYGPRGRPIRPRRAGGYLVFRPRGSNRLVFARQVRGVRPDPYLTDALLQECPWPATITRL